MSLMFRGNLTNFLKVLELLKREDLKNPSWVNKLIHCCPASAPYILAERGYTKEQIEQAYENYLK